jgi:hypothetical protein
MVSTIELEPSEVLKQLARSIHGQLNGLTIQIPIWNSWNDAMHRCTLALAGVEGNVAFFPPLSAAE